MKFSPNGKLLASASLDQTIVLWDAATGKRIRTLRGHSDQYSRIAFSPDGQTIAAGQANGTVKFWDVATGQENPEQDGHIGVVRCVAYSPDGKLLASAGVDKTVQVHETDGGRLVRSFPLSNISDAVAFSADGKRLIATTDYSNPSTLHVLGRGRLERGIVPATAIIRMSPASL